ncbi:MAG: hypothetical protein IKG35_08145 [Erysipelotrichaceae bacterium]|nr:hypothetical protein [Erysipelotrichaceae bacterium]
MPLYVSIRSPLFGDTVITHAGIDGDHIIRKDGKVDVIASIKKAFKADPYNYMIGCDLQCNYLPASVSYELDKYVIVGHVPTIYLENTSKVIVRKHFMDIDTGSSFPEG